MRFHFGEFCFDPDGRELSERGAQIHLTPKAIELLRILLRERPKTLPKEQIYRSLWPDTYVEEANLAVHVSELRAALRDDSREPRFIKTAHRYGYGFIGEVREESSRGTSIVRLRSGRREFELLDGEDIVGRDDDARIAPRSAICTT
jgi:DNA-binding winged helix-turn-helix (wHTH) protein